MYLTELTGGFVILLQSMIGITLADMVKSVKLIKILRKACKLSLFVCILSFLVRIFMYFRVHSAIKMIDINHVDKGIGSFFAEYIDDTTGSTIMTIFLLISFLSFYWSNIYIIKLMGKMIDFINA